MDFGAIWYALRRRGGRLLGVATAALLSPFQAVLGGVWRNWPFLLTVIGLYFAIAELSDQQRFQAWQILSNPGAGNTGKIEALEYLNRDNAPRVPNPYGWKIFGYEVKIGRPPGKDWFRIEFAFWKRQDSLASIDLSQPKDDHGRCGGSTFLEGIKLPGAELSGAKLGCATLNGADLTGADLRWADLTRADLEAADLAHARLYRADLTGAWLYSADLSGVHLLGADLVDADLMSADLTGASLRSANLTGANLRGAVFTRARLYQANLTDANLRLADFTGAELLIVDLSGADLTEADLTGADLRGALMATVRPGTLTQAQIDGACVDERSTLPMGLVPSAPCETEPRFEGDDVGRIVYCEDLLNTPKRVGLPCPPPEEPAAD